MKFSVLVPAHNEARQIDISLNSLALQDLDPEHEAELVVVPNGCNDSTEQIVEEWANGNTGIFNEVQLVSLEKGNKKAALNAGLIACRGEVIMCADADVMQGAGVIDRIVTDFKNRPETMLQGTLTMPNPKLYPEDPALHQLRMYRALRRRAMPVRKSVSGAMMAFRQSADITFPEGQCVDDTWLWHDIINRYGVDAETTHSDRFSYYKPVSTWDEFYKQEARYMLAIPMVAEQFPDLAHIEQAVHDWIDEHTDLEALDQRWRRWCEARGMNFDAVQALSNLATAKATTLMPDIKAHIQENAGQFEVFKTTKGV